MDEYGFHAGDTVPGWLDDAGLEPDYASCLIYLDCGDDLSTSAPLLRYWYREACRLLLPFVAPAGQTEPMMSLSAHEQTIEGRPRRRRPRDWDEGLTEDLYQLSAHWFDVPTTAIASELDLYVFRFADRRHVKLQVSVGFKERSGRLPYVVPALVELARLVGDVADPAYGEIIVNAEIMAPTTMLDGALYRGNEESARASRSYLRGYEWVTICPRELTGRLGGAEALRRTGAFAEVVPLAQGGALLRATPTPEEYRADRIRSVFQALAPVLPPGQPCDLPGHDLSRVVFADARYPVGSLDLGPRPPARGPAGGPPRGSFDLESA
ncbi:hypothetical protein AB0J86_05935 [Micromonospora sp. NPDC049559]|uniref:hypothetical protein n=1 Tax=Micromonospora sp. NPDC049559 TaxID=3155923 RepID=UPI00343C525C